MEPSSSFEDERLPQPTYADTIERLNAKSLRHCLETICMFSCLDLRAGFESPIFPVLNNEKIRLLAEAVIKSKAAWYKEKSILPKDLPMLFNGANTALYDERLKREVVSGGEREEMLYQLQRFFSRSAYLQIRPQQNPIIRLGQVLAMVEVLPRDNWQELPAQVREDAKNFPTRVAEIFGTTAADILAIASKCVRYFNRLGHIILEKLPRSTAMAMPASRQAEILSSLLQKYAQQMDHFRLTTKKFEKIYDESAAEGLRRFAPIFARPIVEHRKLLATQPYQVGPETLRLSTLDRFPLVYAEEPDAWYVPNTRLLAVAAPDVIHFTLNESCRETYELIRGPVLELYLANLVRQRAPHLITLPEERWPTNKGEAAGPDLILIEHGSDPCFVAVEIKFRRMLPSTRFELRDEDMENNYDSLWKAIKAIPGKIAEVSRLAGGYLKHRRQIEEASGYPRWSLGIAGEAPFMFGELASFRARRDPDFPLFGNHDRWLAMTITTFELLIEIIAQKGRSLNSLLTEYEEDCGNLELSGPMAADFRKADISEEQSYAASFLHSNWLG